MHLHRLRRRIGGKTMTDCIIPEISVITRVVRESLAGYIAVPGYIYNEIIPLLIGNSSDICYRRGYTFFMGAVLVVLGRAGAVNAYPGSINFPYVPAKPGPRCRPKKRAKQTGRANSV